MSAPQARKVLEGIYNGLLAQAEEIQSLIEAIDWNNMTPEDHERIERLMLNLRSVIKSGTR